MLKQSSRNNSKSFSQQHQTPSQTYLDSEQLHSTTPNNEQSSVQQTIQSLYQSSTVAVLSGPRDFTTENRYELRSDKSIRVQDEEPRFKEF